jgi:hypothetical protein
MTNGLQPRNISRREPVRLNDHTKTGKWPEERPEKVLRNIETEDWSLINASFVRSIMSDIISLLKWRAFWDLNPGYFA